ncbi:MAG: hypothetical protein RL413_779 [Actinomycetota bacterium]
MPDTSQVPNGTADEPSHVVAGLLMVHSVPKPTIAKVADVAGDDAREILTVPVCCKVTEAEVVDPGASPATTVTVV